LKGLCAAAYRAVTGAVPGDIAPGEACNGVVHVVALTLTKTADALIDPKLVLSWLLTALAAQGPSSACWCPCARRARGANCP